MVSIDSLQQVVSEPPVISSPARISFSTEFLDDANFISICPNKDNMLEGDQARSHHADFEFLSGDLTAPADMMTADELFSEGKLLPFWQIQHIEKLNKITLKPDNMETTDHSNKDVAETRIGWFLDDDPSPRPPKCTILWKELLRLKKQRGSSTLSPSSSSSSGRSSVAQNSSDNKVVKRVKKGLERTRSASIRIRPMINVPICTQAGRNTSALPPLFSLKRSGKLDT